MLRSMQSALGRENSEAEEAPNPFGEFRGVALTNMVKKALGESLGHRGQAHDQIQKIQNSSEEGNERNPSNYEHFGSHTYEDILATAVLNKVLEKCENSCQELSGGDCSLDPAGTDTDSGLSGSIKGETVKRVKKGDSGGASQGSDSPFDGSPKPNYSDNILSKTGTSPAISIGSPDIGVSLDGNPDSSPDVLWSYGNGGPPLQFKIEEHIEEITTHQVTDEESRFSDNEVEKQRGLFDDIDGRLDSSTSGQAKNSFRKWFYASKVSSEEEPNVLPSFDLPSINYEEFSGSSRVPFPELGVDLLHGCSEAVDGGPSELVLDNTDWKENWLFRKEDYKKKRCVQTVDTITMLIPNPSSTVGPTIGDKDIDELSELSDRHSNYSFDTSSEDERDGKTTRKPPPLASKDLIELVGEINAEFGQKDHEYTEDFSSLVQRELSSIHSRFHAPYNNSNSNSNYNYTDQELTGVTPVLKSRTLTHSSKFPQKSIVNSICAEDVPKMSGKSGPTPRNDNYSLTTLAATTLTPPRTVPGALDDVRTSSPTVWFESVLEDLEVPVGRTLRLSCEIQARNIFGVTWYLEGEIVNENKHTITWKKGDTHHLNVFEMSAEKAGNFAVCAYTKSDYVWSRCRVVCIDQFRLNKIPRISLTLSDVIAETGSDVALECHVGGHPEPKVTFFRDNLPLPPYSQVHLIENDQYGTWLLNLWKVNEEDSGQVKAIASNSLGHAVTTCVISVVPEGQLVKCQVNQNQKFDNRTYKKKKKFSQITGNKLRTTTQAITTTPINLNSINYQNFNNISDLNSDSSVVVRPTDEYQTYAYSHNQSEALNNGYFEPLSDETNYCNKEITINGCLFQPPKPGTIAEREHRKWLEAKPLPNNPYSPEKLANRLGRSPYRFPSLPTVYRDTSGDEGLDGGPLRDGLMMSSTSDLSRYSRDYHVNSKANRRIVEGSFNIRGKSETLREVTQDQSRTACLVKIESKKAADWKEELKDIKLDVGKKVADIQKTIDACQHEWRLRMQQRGWNTPSNRSTLPQKHQKLSASCINLNTPPKCKTFSSNRHLVYSSSEALNTSHKREQIQNNLWRTVSVDTLSSPSKNSFAHLYSTLGGDSNANYCRRYGSRDRVERTDHQNHQQFSRLTLSDSDESSGLNTSYCSINNKQIDDNYCQRGSYTNKKMTSYYSENSIESLKEESDTEGSISTAGDSSNLPSVKELASKFDSLKSARKQGSSSKKTHEKPFKASNSKDVLIVEQREQTSPIPSSHNFSNNYNRKYNDKMVVNEVHHSLTARSVSRSFREGLRMHNHRKPQPLLEPLTDESSRHSNHNQEMMQPPHRDTSSPEHLGIPSSPASIPNRHHYAYPPPGDTSDDSSVAAITPRKTYRKKTYSGNQSKGNNIFPINLDSKREPFFI